MPRIKDKVVVVEAEGIDPHTRWECIEVKAMHGS